MAVLWRFILACFLITGGIPMSIPQSADSTVVTSATPIVLEYPWFRFLSRWSLFAGLVALGQFPAFFIGVLAANQNSRLSQDFFDLVAASKNPALYRLAITFDIATWLVLGGFFITLAALLAHRAPIRSTFLAACGIGQVAGVIGAFIRLTGTSALAAQYVTAVPAQQALLRRSYLDLVLVFTAHFGAGQLLWAVALVLGAWGAWSMKEFPRWLTVLIALPGIIALAQILLQLITGADFSILFFPAFLLFIVVFFTIAVVFWRRKPI
jgi:hypothetical protein